MSYTTCHIQHVIYIQLVIYNIIYIQVVICVKLIYVNDLLLKTMTSHENVNSLFYYKPETHLGVSTLSPHAKPFIPRVQAPVIYVNPYHDLFWIWHPFHNGYSM